MMNPITTPGMRFSALKLTDIDFFSCLIAWGCEEFRDEGHMIRFWRFSKATEEQS
jgi:hypothetical protein